MARRKRMTKAAAEYVLCRLNFYSRGISEGWHKDELKRAEAEGARDAIVEVLAAVDWEVEYIDGEYRFVEEPNRSMKDCCWREDGGYCTFEGPCECLVDLAEELDKEEE